jgi:hypothetical protein
MKSMLKKILPVLLSLTLLFPVITSNQARAEAAATASAAAELRVALGQLLGEHAILAVVAMQKGIDGGEDFADAAGALGENTEALTAAITSVYGEAAGEAFNGLWSAHIGFFVDYVVATGANDQAGRQAALDKLDNYRTDFSTFLAGANPNLEASALADGLQMHVNQLVSAFDSYVEGDYETTYASIREAYAHMFMTGAGLSAAIVAQFPDMFAAEMDMVTNIWFKINSNIMKVDGKTVTQDVSPFILDSTTWISLRHLSEALGGEVTWDGETQTVWVNIDGNKAAFWIGSDTMELNGVQKDIGAELFIQDGRTQIPLRFIAELLGWEVEWNQEDWSINLSKQMMH